MAPGMACVSSLVCELCQINAQLDEHLTDPENAVEKGRWEAIFFSPLDRLYFHQALWPFIYFTHFSYKNIYFQKKLQVPSILMWPP